MQKYRLRTALVYQIAVVGVTVSIRINLMEKRELMDEKDMELQALRTFQIPLKHDSLMTQPERFVSG